MSENFKLRLDQGAAETQQERLSRAPDPSSDTAPIDEAESQMRKALGLLGEGHRHRPEVDRSEPPMMRQADRFGAGLHRRRFVQDGDIPVTVLRRDQGHEVAPHRGAAPAASPTTSRLQRTEAALAAETAAREKAERAYQEAQALGRDLQTKIGHAELAKNEAIETLRQERESIAQLRTDLAQSRDQIHEVTAKLREAEQSAETYQAQFVEEQQARKAAEKALEAAKLALEAAELRGQDQAEEIDIPVQPRTPRRPRHEPEAVAASAKRRRQASPAEAPAIEPEPVKWWLNTKPTGKRK